MTSKVSIIIPVYNSEKWIGRCIESALAQTYSQIEVVIINDGSTDLSDQICKEYSAKDSRVKYYYTKNAGVSAARNLGIKESSSKYIVFLDSDDQMSENFVEIMVDLINEYQVDLAVCGLNIYNKGRLLRQPHLKTGIYKPAQSYSDFKYIYRLLASPCNKIYAKDKITPFDLALPFGEDLLFNLKYVFQTNDIIVTDKCLYNVYLDNPDSLNRKFDKGRLDNVLKLEVIKQSLVQDFFDIGQDSFLSNSVILNTHAQFRDIVGRCDFQESIGFIKKYTTNITVQNSIKSAKLDDLDKRLFVQLLRFKCVVLIYFFLYAKLLLNKNVTNS